MSQAEVALAQSLGKGLGASRGGWGSCPQRFCVPLQATWFGHCHRWGQAGPTNAFCSWTPQWGVRTPIHRVPVLPRLQQSTWGESHMLSQHRAPKCPRCGMCLVSTTVPYFNSTELSIGPATLSTSPNSSPESSQGNTPLHLSLTCYTWSLEHCQQSVNIE